jgi:carbonic anhydrase
MTMQCRAIMGVTLTAWILVTFGTGRAQTFGYFGDIGPAYWGELSEDWETCGNGEMQSPVDFRQADLHHGLAIDYGRSTGEIFNNGHTIEVETERLEGDNTLRLGGVVYKLVQFHFHTPSEHRVQGRGFDMELHLVHQSEEGTNAVIGVFLKRGPSSGALTPIFSSLPEDLNVKHELEKPFNPARFLPDSRTHYRYVGSLTTPPCTEGVQWIVMTEPVTISDEDMAQFAERIHFNARVTQRRLR